MATELSYKQRTTLRSACDSAQGFVFEADTGTIIALLRRGLIEATGLGTEEPRDKDVRYQLSELGLRYCQLEWNLRPKSRQATRLWVALGPGSEVKVFDAEIAAVSYARWAGSHPVTPTWLNRSTADGKLDAEALADTSLAS